MSHVCWPALVRVWVEHLSARLRLSVLLVPVAVSKFDLIWSGWWYIWESGITVELIYQQR